MPLGLASTRRCVSLQVVLSGARVPTPRIGADETLLPILEMSFLVSLEVPSRFEAYGR